MNIEFISYSGEYPNLCSGKLVVKLDGKEVSFSPFTKKSPLIGPTELAQYHKFWSPGGSVTFDEDWSECVTHGEWGLKTPTWTNILMKFEMPFQNYCGFSMRMCRLAAAEDACDEERKLKWTSIQ